MLFMEKIISLDSQGRLYLPEEIRKYLKNTTFIASEQDGGICIKPIEQDPLQALSRLGKQKLKKSVKQLKEEARKEIENDAFKKIRRH